MVTTVYDEVTAKSWKMGKTGLCDSDRVQYYRKIKDDGIKKFHQPEPVLTTVFVNSLSCR